MSRTPNDMPDTGPGDSPEDADMVVTEQLEARLAGLTEWIGSTAGPLDRALAAAGMREGVLARIGMRRFSGGEMAALIAIGALGIVIAAATLPSAFSSARDAEKSAAASRVVGPMIAEASPDRERVAQLSNGFTTSYGREAWGDADGDGHFDARWKDLTASTEGRAGRGQGVEAKVRAEVLRMPETQQAAPTRQIIRRAGVEVVAADVQLAFRSAQDLVKPERSEFVQESVLNGSGKAMSGRVVLRVMPDRLAEAMRSARGLGELAAEQAGGDDVTDQLVDLEARIRNEQRVEKEMLELFDLRKDSPLKDVLELREQLARVRQTIESLQGQKEQVSRLVSLATLTIIIRPKPDEVIAKPPVNETPSFGARLSREIGDSWTRGTTNLAESAGWIVRTAVGGLPVWLILGGTTFLLWRAAKRRRKNAV